MVPSRMVLSSVFSPVRMASPSRYDSSPAGSSGYTGCRGITGSPRIQSSISRGLYGANSSVHVFKIQARIALFARSFFTWLSYLALSFVTLIILASCVSVFTGSHPFRRVCNNESSWFQDNIPGGFRAREMSA